MERMAISKFKARCLGAIERVRRTRQPLMVTRFGTPVAEVVPPRSPKPEAGWLGCMKGTARIAGDLVAPASSEREWEALRR
ncbi:MAG: type II toxin-antitoxin system Phd/YefM family antitoxin [Candidatus Coatesbacteria bacterium]